MWNTSFRKITLLHPCFQTPCFHLIHLFSTRYASHKMLLPHWWSIRYNVSPPSCVQRVHYAIEFQIQNKLFRQKAILNPLGQLRPMPLTSPHSLKYMPNCSMNLRRTVKHTLMQFSLAMSILPVLFPLFFKEILTKFISQCFFLPMSIVRLEGLEKLEFVEGLKAEVGRRGFFTVLHIEIQVIRGGTVECESNKW